MLIFQKTETPAAITFTQKNGKLTAAIAIILILLYLFLPQFLSSASVSLTQFTVPDLIILMLLYAAWEIGPLYMAVSAAQSHGIKVNKSGDWWAGNLIYEIEKL